MASSNSDTEKSSLINNTKSNPKINFSSYGTYEDFSRSSKRKEEGDVKKISLARLFRFATKTDILILLVGTVFSVVHGAGLPLLALVFGEMTNVFLQQTLHGFAKPETDTSPTFSDLVSPVFSQVTASSTVGSLNAASVSNEDLLTPEEFFAYMTTFALYYAYIGAVVFVASFVQAMCWEISCERQTFRLRQAFFYQVIRQEIGWFDTHQTGDLAMKLSDDLERVREGIGHKFSMVVQYASTFLTGFLVGFAVSWQLTLVILAVTPLLAGTSAWTGMIIATQSAREQQKYGKAGAIADEVLSCIRTVASFGGEVREIRRYESALMEAFKLAIKKYHTLSVGIGLVFFVMYGSYALAFWYGCQLLADNVINPGQIFTVFFSVLMGAFSLGNAVPYVATIGVAQGSGAVVFQVIDSQPKIDPYSKTGHMPDSVTGKIEFRNVFFRYPTRREVSILQKFNIEIEPGKTVAIVGASGAGKSTIISLLLRFYDSDSGSVMLDGFDVKGLNLAWLRHHIGVVSQEPVLFGTTIYENISYGREFVTPDEVVTAARMANAHDFISSLPQGYETLVGERGCQLSGGQKQRIAIARALVRDPRILLLDEATSALDAKSEAVVQAALDKARQGRTTIIVAHRLSTIKDADVIYALKDGTVHESGTHCQLMAKEGLYYDLVTNQITLSTDDDVGGIEASAESTEESLHDYEYNVEMERKRRRRTRGERQKLRGAVFADPDKARLINETRELKVKYPGIFKILKVNTPEWKLLIGGLVGCVIAGAVLPIFALFYAEMFTSFTLTGQDLMDAATFWSLMFLGLAFTSGFGFWLRTIFVSTAGEYLTMRLRTQSYIGILRQPIGWFDKHCNSPNRLSTRLARDTPMVKGAAGHRLSVVVSSLVTIVASVSAAFFLGWQLALVLMVGFPLLVIAGYIQIQVQKGGQKKDAILMEDAGRVAIEAIQNIRTVQSISQEKLFFQKYLEFLLPAYKEAQYQGIIYGVAFAFSEAVVFLIYAGSFYYGGYLIGVEVMTPVNVFRIFFAIAFSAVSVGQATSFIPDYTKANLAAGLIFNLIETESNIDPFGPDGLRPKFEGRITFSEVKFRYPNREEFPVLQGLSFDLQPGRTLALVGPSGCGKSTVVSLLERFYDVSGGQVMIDGYDARSINVSHLRQNIGLVRQEPVLFDCSIRDNIAYGHGIGDARVPDDLIIEAARSANIHNFIVGLPQGYETLVGERGTQLSGGQKQRIAIARALIRNPKILLLDEATSALDTESEKIVQEALDRARTGRTCIIIAHRLSTIQNADCIAVVNRGKIVEIGSHDQLRAKKGIYFKLTKKQVTH